MFLRICSTVDLRHLFVFHTLHIFFFHWSSSPLIYIKTLGIRVHIFYVSEERYGSKFFLFVNLRQYYFGYFRDFPGHMLRIESRIGKPVGRKKRPRRGSAGHVYMIYKTVYFLRLTLVRVPIPRIPVRINASHRKGMDASPVFGTGLGVGVAVGWGVAVSAAFRIFREVFTSPSVKEILTV